MSATRKLKPVVMWAVVHDRAKQLPHRGVWIDRDYFYNKSEADAEARYNRPNCRVIKVRVSQI